MLQKLKNKIASSGWNKLSFLNIARYVSVTLGAVILICVLIFIFSPDTFINSFVKNRITKAFVKAYPSYTIQLGQMHYSVWKNRLKCDSIKLMTNDSAFSYSIASLSVSGISWMKILLKGDYSSNILSNSVIDAQNIELYNPQDKNKICFGKLHISVSDSELVADSVKYDSLIDDERFFAKSQFRQTIYRFDIPQIKIIGLDCRSLLSGNGYIAGNIKIFDLFADILVNMDKPYDKNSPRPLMPNELLASIKEIVNIDSLIIINGRLRYCERYVVKEKPGVISIDKINVSVSGIANDTVKPKNTVIRGQGLFMNSGTMKVLMAIPLTSKDFSLQYSGSIGSIDITCLNAFIEAGEHRRIKSGAVQSAVFNINVKSGIAIGTVRAEYKDLSIAVLNKNTGSEKGLLDRVSSLYGNLFVTRGSNIPDEKGLIKVGQINYKKNLADYFFQFIWFALRGGIGNLVGF